MLKGDHICTLMIGPLVPVPAPQVVMDALTERVGDGQRRRPERIPTVVHARAITRRCTRFFS